MAAPTDVRVESNSLTTATLRWSYAGSANVEVWRSLTSGSGFSEVTTAATRLQPGTTTYVDESVAEGTQYFYKLSDDNGATFSSEVSVVIQTCFPPGGSMDTFSLPRAGESVEGDDFNNLAQRVEEVLGGRLLSPFECIACPEDGALVLNCAGHCREWLVIADQDINSISLQYCDEGDANIDFIIPPGATRRIDGWPGGYGFSGDEGFWAPISGGANGRTVGVGKGKTSNRARPSRSGSRPGTGSGGGQGGTGCTCVPNGIGALKIKSCRANNSLDCSGTKSLKLLVCGGRGPYTWSVSGAVRFKGKTSTANPDGLHTSVEGESVTVVPPVNTGSAVAGTAYQRTGYMCVVCFTSSCVGVAVEKKLLIGCDDVVDICGDSATIDVCAQSVPTTGEMTCHNGDCGGTPGALECGNPDCPNTSMAGLVTRTCDARTAPMIAAGCNPCGLNDGDTVTVTDAVGTQVTIILRA